MSDTTVQDELVPVPVVKQEEGEKNGAPLESSTTPDGKTDNKMKETTEEAPAKAEGQTEMDPGTLAQTEENNTAEPKTVNTKTEEADQSMADSDASADANQKEAESKSKPTEKDAKSRNKTSADGAVEPHRKFIKPPNKKNNLPISDNAEEIRDQIEWYFGDSNLPQDEHMWKITGGPDNRPVQLSHMCTFGRMQHFQPYSAVAKALRESKTLVLSGEAGKEEIQRREPYELQSRPPSDRIYRTVYAKGFGEEDGLLTQVEIERFFKKYGHVNIVKLRRDEESGVFKGSVFTEFSTVADATKFVKADPKPTYQGEELVTMMKKEYIDMKSKLIAEGKMEPSKKGPAPQYWEGTWNSKYRRGDRNGRGGHHNQSQNGKDKSDWKTRRNNDQKNGFRGGRGGGRGGRGGRGRGGGYRNLAPNRPDPVAKSANIDQLPVIKATEGDAHLAKKPNKKPASSAKPATNGKRGREDDAQDGSERPAKKVNTVKDSDTPATSGKPATNRKRGREDHGQDGTDRPAKKVDTKKETVTAA